MRKFSKEQVDAARKMFVPKGAVLVADKKSDAVAFLYVSGNGKPAARVFVGKQSKPLFAHYFSTEKARENAVTAAFENRRARMGRAKAAIAERVAYVHDYTVGEILHTSWGYDQTNVEYFEIVAVKGKFVTLREIAQSRAETNFMQGTCVPLAGKYIGEAIRRMGGKHGIKIDSVRTAFRSETKTVAGIKVHQPLGWSSYA
jgi:alkanesulfonate monooxygenase SsuD/methylene tetrahydromethanopterin reductase-like flavin-dependent oxidoreductase (luciferase family)